MSEAVIRTCESLDEMYTMSNLKLGDIVVINNETHDTYAVIDVNNLHNVKGYAKIGVSRTKVEVWAVWAGLGKTEAARRKALDMVRFIEPYTWIDYDQGEYKDLYQQRDNPNWLTGYANTIINYAIAHNTDRVALMVSYSSELIKSLVAAGIKPKVVMPVWNSRSAYLERLMDRYEECALQEGNSQMIARYRNAYRAMRDNFKPWYREAIELGNALELEVYKCDLTHSNARNYYPYMYNLICSL